MLASAATIRTDQPSNSRSIIRTSCLSSTMGGMLWPVSAGNLHGTRLITATSPKMSRVRRPAASLQPAAPYRLLPVFPGDY